MDWILTDRKGGSRKDALKDGRVRGPDDQVRCVSHTSEHISCYQKEPKRGDLRLAKTTCWLTARLSKERRKWSVQAPWTPGRNPRMSDRRSKTAGHRLLQSRVKCRHRHTIEPMRFLKCEEPTRMLSPFHLGCNKLMSQACCPKQWHEVSR